MTNDVTTWPSLFSEYSAAEVLETRGDTVRFWLAIRKAGVLIGARGFDGYNSSVLIRPFRPAE